MCLALKVHTYHKVVKYDTDVRGRHFEEESGISYHLTDFDRRDKRYELGPISFDKYYHVNKKKTFPIPPKNSGVPYS